jgi:hypothetical protein
LFQFAGLDEKQTPLSLVSRNKTACAGVLVQFDDTAVVQFLGSAARKRQVARIR